MPLPIEDYALISSTHAAALVGRDGSIDWLCLPRFDSGACFCALLGGPEHGRWLIAPTAPVQRTSRRYRKGTLLLETEIETESGRARITDCMPRADGRSDVVRLVEGLRGKVEMRTELVFRFDYGAVVPWVQSMEDGIVATAGPDSLIIRTSVRLEGKDKITQGRFEVAEGETLAFTLSYFRSHERPPTPIDPLAAAEATADWWREWSGRSTYSGDYADAVERSLITLKALTFAPTGGIVAAPTASLPESLGGARNWDYRFCWLRDATFTLYALLMAGYVEEAIAWREWLLRVAAGRPQDLQILYGVAGERRLSETLIDWLPGYAGSSPVRVGNAAHTQLQLDVYGEVFDALHLARRARIEPRPHAWELQRVLLDFLESSWDEPDNGIWEVRGGRRHFTHSKVMAWVAFDRGVKSIKRYGLEGPLEHWQGIRDRIHAEVCERGFDPERNTFVQEYGGKELDASLLMVPLVGFLPASDPRVRGTAEAVQRELLVDGLVLRYQVDHDLDDIAEGEGVFLPCSFWLVDNLAMTGQVDEARELFERLLGLCNDVGLISEEYDVQNHRMLGNFPQAFTHVGLINSARNLSKGQGPSEHRSAGADEHR